MRPADIVTLIRLILAPIIAYLIITQNRLLAFILFIIAAISDIFDGYVARKTKQKGGENFDIVADITLYLCCAFAFYITRILTWSKNILFVYIMLLIYLVILFKVKKIKKFPPRLSGKILVYLLSIAIALAILDIPYYNIIAIITAIVGIYTALDYIILFHRLK